MGSSISLSLLALQIFSWKVPFHTVKKSNQNFRDITWNVEENEILHEIVRISRLPRYISCSIGKIDYLCDSAGPSLATPRKWQSTFCLQNVSALVVEVPKITASDKKLNFVIISKNSLGNFSPFFHKVTFGMVYIAQLFLMWDLLTASQSSPGP